jgi:hypothetical protein
MEFSLCDRPMGYPVASYRPAMSLFIWTHDWIKELPIA